MGLPLTSCGCPSVDVGQPETPAEALRTKQRSWQAALAAKPWLRKSVPADLLPLIDRQPLAQDLAQDAAVGVALDDLHAYGQRPAGKAARHRATAQQDGRGAPIGPVLRHEGPCEWTGRGTGGVGAPIEGIDYQRRTVRPWHLGAESTILLTGAVAEGVSTKLSEALDTAILNMVALLEIPNASFSLLSPDGRLVMARGYTNLTALRAEHGADWCDAVFLTQPDSQFRIASLTKPMTACAVMQQVQRGLYSLEDSAVAQMNSKIQALIPNRVQTSDGVNRFPWSVRVWHLLTHSAGWCERTDEEGICDQRADPLNEDEEIAKAYLRGVLPVSRPDVVGFAFDRETEPDVAEGALPRLVELDSGGWLPPGQQSTYDNFSFFLLGRVMEGASMVGYAGSMRQLVFDPLGMSRSGTTSSDPTDRAPWEVAYYSRDPSHRPTVLDPYGEQVPRPYGAQNLANSDSAKGLLSTAVDLARFLRGNQLDTVADGAFGNDWLSVPTLASMMTKDWERRIEGHVFTRPGLGWLLGERARVVEYAGFAGNIYDLHHTGRLRGTAAYLSLNPPPDPGGFQDPTDSLGSRRTRDLGAGLGLLFNKDVNAGTVPSVAAPLAIATDGSGDMVQKLWSVVREQVHSMDAWGTGDLMKRYP